MKTIRQGQVCAWKPVCVGFTLIEVVLALGVFLVTALGLVGLIGPTLTSIREVGRTDEVVSVVSSLNAFLQGEPGIASAGSRFDAVYEAVREGGHATVFVFRRYGGTVGTGDSLEVGFVPTEPGIAAAGVVADFSDAAGPVYRVVLTVSPVTPANHVTDRGAEAFPRYVLSGPAVAYPAGYLAMRVRIFAEEPPGPGERFDAATGLAVLAGVEPLFVYDTAIVR